VARFVPIAVSGLLALALPGGALRADPPPPDTSATGDNQVAESKDGLFSSLRQAFGEDLDREVVRGHFDVGPASNRHRYYCLVDPKKGKREVNGVSGDPYQRRDGMTALRNAAVTPLSCADAEQKGLLVTAGYVVHGKDGSAAPVAPAAAPSPAPLAAAAPATLPAPAAASAPPPAAPPPPAPVPAPVVAAMAAPAAAGVQGDVMAVFTRFIDAANAHDRSAVAAVLLDSRDFVLAPPRGETIWGAQPGLEALAQGWKGSWKLDPQIPEARIASVAPESAILVTPLLLTEGPTTVPVRWSGVFVRTHSGWRIAAIFMTPYADWHSARGR
jgi:ketosteroid isomerase-like protein